MKTEMWFIEEISPWDMKPLNVDLKLSNYKLLSHTELEKKHNAKISRLRNIVICYETIEPGRAVGFINIANHLFKLEYAWGGLTIKDQLFNKRKSFTVKISGLYCEKFFREIGKEINKHEGKKKTHFVDLIFPSQIRYRHYDIKIT